MATYTASVKTDAPEPPELNQSQSYIGLEFTTFNQPTSVKEELTDPHAERNTTLKTLGNVKPETNQVAQENILGCDAQGYMPHRPGQLECINSECNGHRSYVDKYKDPLAAFNKPLDGIHTPRPQANGDGAHQNENFSLLQSALKTIQNSEYVSDEFPNTSDEESDEENNPSMLDDTKTNIEQFKVETGEMEVATDIGSSICAENNGVNGEIKDQSEQYVNINRNAAGRIDRTRQCDPTSALKVNNSVGFECQNCLKRFDTKYKLKRHSASHKSKQEIDKPPFSCHLCSKSYTRKDNYRYHMETHDDMTYTCEHCNAVYKHSSQLVKHYKYKHSNQHGIHIYECSLCSKSYATNYGFSLHMDKHKGVRHECTVCGKTFSRKGTLTMHLKRHSNDPNNTAANYVACDICEKLFTTQANLELHMQVHMGTQKYICKTCDARFSRFADLQRHEYIHTGEKPYKCTDCGKCFRLPGDLGRHRKQHIENYQTCTICDQTYIRFSEFTRHMVTHGVSAETEKDGSGKETKQYACKLCPAVLRSELYFLNHMKRHDDQSVDRPGQTSYPCDQCSQCFTTSSNRARHKRRHHQSKDVLFVCDICTKVFTSSDSLKFHIRSVHLNQKPYPCPHCKQGFYKKKDRERHIQKMHIQEK